MISVYLSLAPSHTILFLSLFAMLQLARGGLRLHSRHRAADFAKRAYMNNYKVIEIDLLCCKFPYITCL